MSHTFAIRFARSAGLAAMLEAPSNSFRWKGGGQLSIDPEGVSIAVKRGLLSLFARSRTRHIAAADLTEVYREGDALRLEFTTPDTPRAVMPFWALDRDTAAQIVRLLPTQRTVELDEQAPTVSRFRVDARVVAGMVFIFALILIGVFLLTRPPASAVADAPEVAAPTAAAAASPVLAPTEPVPSQAPSSSSSLPGRLHPEGYVPPAPAASRPGSVADAPRDAPSSGGAMDDTSGVAPVQSHSDTRIRTYGSAPARHARVRDGVIPITPGQPEYEAARRQLDWFEAQVRVLREGGGQGSWDLAVRIYNSEEFENLALRPMIRAELAALRAWGYGDQEFAERLTVRVSLYVSN